MKSEVFLLDKLESPGITTQGQRWSFFTDGVMGGLSQGSAKIDQIENINCYRMIGDVTTENNGGFIQIRSIMDPKININDYEGIYLTIYGNEKKYYIFLRTMLTLRPWHYYSHSFNALKEWKNIKIPFKNFKSSNSNIPPKLKNQKIESIGLVAGFDDYKADICMSEIGFY